MAKPRIVRRALLTALIVGTVLTLVNHGAALVRGGLGAELLWPVVLTFLTPYVVASVSSAMAVGGEG
jgi:hypothetical protein